MRVSTEIGKRKAGGGRGGRAAGCWTYQGCKTNAEEVQPGERHHIHRELWGDQDKRRGVAGENEGDRVVRAKTEGKGRL
jgi:hypothetical protein